ncbi:flagellar hook protein FlgE [Tabrizicola sp. TH137]|uniref:flagellar hook protein FlgE n=1 Tax=Tabrizicola sp. TH137 TaxID=2067452 RepID=UPI000C7E7482|nr:flagellar hook protein FlgE [Tabrizicola sp. TH137]PLL12122.1 flagellar hook protein FlgE [Tabrizicola sp. TH137]
MSMSTALSGLMAAQSDISATSHNIANVGTMGFRSSRVEFADVFSSSPFANQRTAIGSGVQVQRVAQDFTQGNVVTTGNLLDIAIEGQGFFAIQSFGDPNTAAGEMRYTRAGAFTMDVDGNVVNSAGSALLSWPVGLDGRPLTFDMAQARPLTIPLEMGTPVASTEINLELNFPSDNAMLGQQAAVPPTVAFNPADPTTYATRTPIPLFGPSGTPVEAEAYLIKIASPDAVSTDTIFEVRLLVQGTEVAPTAPATQNRITFDANGDITAGQTLPFGTDGLIIDLGGSSLSDDPFAVQTATHNGASAGRLTNLELDGTGGVWATYGNNGRMPMGQIVLANFTNPGGLKINGNATYSATAESGLPITGTPGTSGFGLLRSGALERSNVELTEELVNLISAQRNYQASAKAMETSTSLMQTIMNIRT